ncbi:MAG: DUF3892 domain-containing protein [Clostridium sp.]
MADKIQETIKNSSGEITHYVLSSGETLEKQAGVERAKNGGIEGVIISHSRKGEEYLRTKPDGKEGNNLSSMSSQE